MTSILRYVLLTLCLALVPSGALAQDGQIAVTAAYRERSTLPADAILDVELLDVSRADAPAIRIASQRFRMDRVPLRVSLSYDPAVIDDRMTYSIAARVISGQQVIFRTTSSYPVITRGAPVMVDILLIAMPEVRPDQASADGQRIAGITWALNEIGGRAFIGEDPPTIAFEEDGSFSLYAGCNRFRGMAAFSEGEMVFRKPLAGTKRACPEPRMRIERGVLEALDATVSYRRYGSSLALGNTAGRATMRFGQRLR